MYSFRTVPANSASVCPASLLHSSFVFARVKTGVQTWPPRRADARALNRYVPSPCPVCCTAGHGQQYGVVGEAGKLCSLYGLQWIACPAGCCTRSKVGMCLRRLTPLPHSLLGAEQLAESWDWCACPAAMSCAPVSARSPCMMLRARPSWQLTACCRTAGAT